MNSPLDNQLMDFWKTVFNCTVCGLGPDYGPQFRPIGSFYRKGGVVFVQINPGHIGRLSDEEIDKRYKRQSSRDIAHRKVESTRHLVELQRNFCENPVIDNWRHLCASYREALLTNWGWPPGKYAATIKNHGVDFDSVAIINLAQCPISNDRYTANNLVTCNDRHTCALLNILQPGLIVAQGKIVHRLLKDNPRITVPVVEGVHHASRQSTAEKAELFEGVRLRVQGLLGSRV